IRDDLVTGVQTCALPISQEFTEDKLRSMVRVWDAIHMHAPKAAILQSNYVMPYERFFGNFDHKVPGSLYAIAGWLNARVAEEARSEERRGGKEGGAGGGV